METWSFPEKEPVNVMVESVRIGVVARREPRDWVTLLPELSVIVISSST